MNNYVKTNWVNGQAPPLSAENLNKIESGIEAVTNAATALETKKINIAVAYNKDKAALRDGEIHIDDAVANDTIYLIKNSADTTVGKLIPAGVDGSIYKKIQLRLLGGNNPEISCRIIDYSTDPATVGNWTKFAYASDIPTVPTKTSDLTNDSGFLTAHQDISGKVDKTRTIAGIDLQDDISSSDLADALWDDLGIEDSAKRQQFSIPNLNDLKLVPKGQYYYSSERETIGVKLSDATSISDSSPAQYIETYTADHIDTAISSKENVSNKSNNFSFDLTPTAAEENQYPTVAQLKRFLSGTYYDINEINAKIGNIETLLSQV